MSTARSGQTARQKARERRVALEATTKARNDRIENWTAAVFLAIGDRGRALREMSAAENAMADALLGLAGEGLTTSEVANLCELTTGEVQKLTKHRRGTTYDQERHADRAGDRSTGSIAGGVGAESRRSSGPNPGRVVANDA